MIAEIVLCILAVCVGLWRYSRAPHSKVTTFMNQVGGPPQLPLLGNTLDFIKPIEETTRQMQFDWPKRYGPRYAFALGPFNFFTSRDPSDIERLLTSTREIQKGSEYGFLLGDWLGDGLLISKGKKWVQRRKLLTPSFHFKILEEFLPIVNENAKTLTEILKTDSDGGRQTLEMCQYLGLCTLDIICETAMGTSINAQRNGNREYVQAVKDVNHCVMRRFLTPWLQNSILWFLSPTGKLYRRQLKLLHDFTENVIRERKLELGKMRKQLATVSSVEPEVDVNNVYLKKKRAIAFMDMLLEAQANNPADLTDHDIREEVDTFMFEGQDTTSASLGWTVFLLANNPACQVKLFEELDNIFGDDRDRPVTSSDLAVLKYLECCIKESLRLYPSVPFLSRKLENDLKLDDQVTMPAGMTFALYSLSVHRNPKIFQDPETFDPERHFPENSARRHPFSYVPFSAGPRNCIGQKFALMEIKVILANVFRNFEVEAVDCLEDVIVLMEIITRSKNGLRVRFRQRGI